MAPWIKAQMRAMLKAERRQQLRQRRGLLGGTVPAALGLAGGNGTALAQ
jgi:hypothetical protein